MFTYEMPTETPAWRRHIRKMADAHNARMEAQLKRLLSRWVSELEPCMVFSTGPNGWVFEGLGIAGLPNGSPRYIVIPAEGK